jgi:hypothetical protein
MTRISVLVCYLVCYQMAFDLLCPVCMSVYVCMHVYLPVSSVPASGLFRASLL